MKKLIITLSFSLLVLLGYSQATNVGEYRVADANTAFGVNLPIGTKVYDIANNKYYVAIAGVISTANLTSASASFSLLNNLDTDDQTAAEVDVTATGNLSSTKVQAALEELQGDIDGISSAGYLTTEVDGSTTNEIQTIDEALLNGTTLELSLSSDGQATKEIDLSSLLDGTGTDDQGLTFNSGTHAIDIEDGGSAVIPLATTTITGLASGAQITAIGTNTSNISSNSSAISTNTSNISTNASNISDNTTDIAAITSNKETALSTGTVNGTSYGITSDGGANDVVLVGATNTTAGVMTAAQVTKLEGLGTLITEKFEVNSTPDNVITLTQSAITAQSCRVALNGSTLAPSAYTLAATTITINVPVYQYDQVVITYMY